MNVCPICKRSHAINNGSIKTILYDVIGKLYDDFGKPIEDFGKMLTISGKQADLRVENGIW
jgi:hypothetical protein